MNRAVNRSAFGAFPITIAPFPQNRPPLRVNTSFAALQGSRFEAEIESDHRRPRNRSLKIIQLISISTVLTTVIKT